MLGLGNSAFGIKVGDVRLMDRPRKEGRKEGMDVLRATGNNDDDAVKVLGWGWEPGED